ncbi:uncharacterized protein LOC119185099 [Rhipicephalus microplus]|uniref:uncharacterized protein LOC119185099 n=1 Tax=Rhipicephalus microplus TaxID=6941 RepID=UPI003F6D257F
MEANPGGPACRQNSQGGRLQVVVSEQSPHSLGPSKHHHPLWVSHLMAAHLTCKASKQQSLGCQGPLRRSALRLDLLWGLRRRSLCNNPLGNEGSAPWLKLLRTTSASRHLTFRAAISAMMVAALANLLRKNVVLEVVDI